MKNYYFTFGQNHWTGEGYPMKNSWVRVVAESYGKARELFVDNFSNIHMEKPDKWAFQYEEKDFGDESKALYPNGEFKLISQ